ncbi:uncharacterized protein LOC111367259 isoform X1 [Olea europaea subsp. europaea]|uniref:Uncharacterized protein LOC111367259 isoform X1 n=2 Tax=Olea europaea subsp. europaea TaxID=158383 RepID=A0A8S0RIL6_OLEEU|nr:uncharacterized protein LOC111367259 isoform X1 [Olea europaea subsp. europaea]
MAAANPLACILWLLFLSYSFLPSVSSADELSLVIGESASLQLSPSLIVEKSPGSKPGTNVKCDRVHIHGFPRLKHLSKFANSIKVKVSYVNPSGRPPSVEICFHSNLSLGIGMCPQGQWERLTEGLWVGSMSPFGHKLLDIRMGAASSGSLHVFLDEEFYLFRVVFLVLGITMMTLASCLSKSLVFYYSGAMSVGVLLVILVILFQGMKLLPTGRKSSLAIFLYSCFVGVGFFLLDYVPKLLRSLLAEIGISEDFHNPLAIFPLVFLVIAGAWLGYWIIRKLVLTEDGSIDIGVSHFVAWSIRIVASVMILQSSEDHLFAVEALVAGIFVSSALKKLSNPKVIRRVYKRLCRLEREFEKSLDPYASQIDESYVSRPFTRSPRTPLQGSISKSSGRLSDSGNFFSSFHSTPERRNFSKDEWEKFTRATTRKALEGLVSSPDFNKWAVANADRITLAPKKEAQDHQRRWFRWL